jgi:hypothetical protein
VNDRVALILTACTAALHLAVANHCDTFRNELYFVICGRHPDRSRANWVMETGAELHRCAVRRERHDSGRHLVKRYLAVDVTLRNCQRLLGIDVPPVNVQRAENTCDIVSALSAEAGFIRTELAQSRYSSRVECYKPISRVSR